MTDATVTGNLLDALGSIYSARGAKMWVTFNTENGRITDENGNIRVGAGRATVLDNGAFTIEGIPVPAVTSNPTSFQVKIHYEISRPVLPETRGVVKERGDFGWMTITGDALLKDLEEEQYVPPEYLTMVTTALQTYVDSSQAAATTASAGATTATAAATLAQTLVTSDLGTTDGQSFALVSDSNSQTGGYLEATYAGLDAAVNNFTGKIEVDGGFTNSYDTDLWIAGATRTNPANNSQGMYIQHRVAGDLGGLVHDGSASELRIFGGSNSGAGQNAFEDSLVITGGVNALSALNGITSNFHTEGTPSGTVDSVSLYRSQTIPAMTGTVTVSKVYGVYIEPQTVGTTENWSLYAPTGVSLMGTLVLDSPSPSASRAVQFSTNKVQRWQIRANSTAEGGGNAGSDLEINCRTDAGASNLTPVVITRSTGLVAINNGLKVTGNLGFYGTTPIAKQTLAAAATDAATTQTLVNDIRTKLIALGLTA